MGLGHGQTRSVLILWTWTALLSGLVLYPTLVNRAISIVPFAALALGVALYTLFGVRGRGESRVEPRDEDVPVGAGRRNGSS